MKKAVIILVILGTMLSLGLGIKWLSDYDDSKAQIASITNMSKDISNNSEINEALKEVETAKNCAIALIACGIIALISVFLLGKIGKIGAGIILVSGVVPAIFTPISLAFTFFLVIGGILAFFIKPKVRAA